MLIWTCIFYNKNDEHNILDIHESLLKVQVQSKPQNFNIKQFKVTLGSSGELRKVGSDRGLNYRPRWIYLIFISG